MRRGRSNRVGLAGVALAIALLVPPLSRIAWRMPAVRERLGLPLEAPDDGTLALAESVRLREELRRARATVDSLTETAAVVDLAGAGARIAGARARFRQLAADVMRFEEPSPDRDALWIVFAAQEAPAEPAAVVSGDRLVGRLVPSPLGQRVARVQTLRDPLVRVRFRSQSAIDDPSAGGGGTDEALGILWGTGQVDGDGRALLEVHHPTATAALVAGARIVTAGDDGVYPPGLLIGEIVEPGGDGAARADGGGKARVRAAARPLELARVVVVVDRARAEYAARNDGWTRGGASDDGGGR